jgi:hypothetical protein
MDGERIGTSQKALSVNLTKSKYGTFAEIGAGQEVVRWFFQAGGASGTIAKSMSAYDMTVSDAIYGSCARYVSRQRLETMLNYEYDLMLERLDAKRGAETEFFVFADTVAARSFRGNNECHGWMGVKFQSAPRAEPNEILIHVRMLDKEHVAQQHALGILGVNLIHGAFFLHETPDVFLQSLLDSLSPERIEVDMVKFIGPAFNVDDRLMSLKLVQLGLSDAAMFAPDGSILQPSEVLYKKPVLVERGSFRPVTYVNLDMLDTAREQFMNSAALQGESEVVVLAEITMKNLMSTGDEGEVDYADFLARAELLAATGHTVLISDYFEYYRLAAYLARFSKKPIGITMGIPSVRELFDEKYYEHLEGGILESFGRLFKNDLKLFVYPLKDPDTGQLINVQKLKVAPHLQRLYGHLVENDFVESLDFFNREYLPIYSRDVLAKIRDGDESWERMVPPEVATLIKERGYFGYQAPLQGSVQMLTPTMT